MGGKRDKPQTTTQTAAPWVGIQPYITGGYAPQAPAQQSPVSQGSAGFPGLGGGRMGFGNTGRDVMRTTQGIPATPAAPEIPGVLPEAARLYSEDTGFGPETMQALQAMNRLDSNLYGQTQDELMSTIQGDYLNNLGSDNFMSAYGDDIIDQVNSMFGTGGRVGSGYNIDTATKELGNVASRLYNQQYESERNRQMQALGMVPAFESGMAGAALPALQAGQMMDNQDWDALNRYSNLIASMQSGIPATTTASQPMYRNPLAGGLGGALAGAQLGKAVPGLGIGVGAGLGALAGLLS